MIDISKVKDIYLYSKHIDMRFGMFKIEMLLSLSFSPIEVLNSAFIFVSKNRKQIKIYIENEYGKWLMINRLSYTTFQIPDLNNISSITKNDLDYLLKGVVIESERMKYASI